MNRNLLAVLMLIGGLTLTVVGHAWAKDQEAKAFLGVVPAELTSDIAAEYGVTPGAGHGVLIEGVTSGSPAESIGLRENDIILRINGAEVTGPAELRTQLSKYKPGEKVELVYLRGGKEKTTQVELAERDDGPFSELHEKLKGKSFSFEGPPWEWKSQSENRKVAYAGIVTQKLTEGLASYFKVEKGVLISDVMKGSPAETAGLKAGDIILKIGDQDIEDRSDVSEAVQNHDKGEKVDFLIKREGVDMTISVTLGEQMLGMMDDPQINVHVFGDDLPGMENVIVNPHDLDLKDLQDELEQLRIELKDLPDINVKIKTDGSTIRNSIRTDAPTGIQSANYMGGWRASLHKFQDQILNYMNRLRSEINDLKLKILEMKEQIIAATA